jgi:hypothetical protein
VNKATQQIKNASTKPEKGKGMLAKVKFPKKEGQIKGQPTN